MKPFSIPLLAQLSHWANKHPVTARGIIIINRIILGYAAFYSGVVLADNHCLFSEKIFFACAAAFSIGFILYPRKNKKWPVKTTSFAWRKSCDGLLVMSSCLFWLAAGNFILPYQPTIHTTEAPVKILQSVITKNGKGIYYPKSPSLEAIKKAKKQRGNLFKKFKNWRVRFFKKLKARALVKLAFIKSAYKELDGGTIALLVLASLAVIGLLGYVTIAISCSLSCNGQEGAATTVALLGCAATIGVVVWIWSSAIKSNRRKSQARENIRNIPSPPKPIEREVVNPNLKICLETDDPKGLSGINLSMNGKVLQENMQVGSQPDCFDLTVQPDIVNSLKVTGATSPVKVSIEDGIFLKRLTLPTNGAGPGILNLVLKKP